MIYKCTSAIITIILILLSAGSGVFAQDTAATDNAVNAGHPYIQWINQFPARKQEEVKVNTFKKIYNFLVQKDKELSLTRPVAVVAGSPANMWVLDQGAATILLTGKKKVERPKSVRKKENYFTSLVDMCSLPGGDLIFTDSRLNKVFILSGEEKKLCQLNDTIKFQQPTGIAYSAVTNEIWVVETAAHRVAVFKRNGELVKTIGSRGDDTAQFNFPTAICIDKAGDVYIVDAMNFRVQIFNKEGKYITSFGEAGDISGSFARPKGIAIDSYGNIYISDALFHVVQIFDRAGNFLYSFGKQGRGQAEFWMPSGIFIDSKNYIYVADSYNSRVQIFQLINGS